jgi:Ni,Fe-hydrogenase maturation factor
MLDSLRAAHPRPEAPPLRLKRGHQLAPELAEPVSRAHAVVFVDASADGTPGAAGPTPLNHALSPSVVLLFGHVPRAAVVTVGGGAFDHGTELSPEALQAVPRAARRIRSIAHLWARRALAAGAGA